jgi:membrane protein YdbS with pleckstrin-like domain
MGSKSTMLLLWVGAVVSIVVVLTQSSTRTWLAYGWTAVCLVVAVTSTVMFQIERRQQKRWNAGNYD